MGATTWKILGTGGAVLSGIAARKLLNTGWKAATGTPPPANPEHPDVDWHEAVLWAVLSGAVIGVARIAAIQGAKRTSDLIPLCHPLAITRVKVDFALDESVPCVHCTAQVETFGRTGVEMEALTAVQVGLLTVYDMCKAVDRGMTITDVRVMEKHGGKSGDWKAD